MASLIGAGASLLGGVLGGKGASKAAKIQAQAMNNAIAEQKAEFAQTQQNIQPYVTAGNTALTGDNGLMTLLGLNGNDSQSSAIAALKASPAFTSQYGTGVDTVLQNAAATGGLRGGNTTTSLANFGSNLLNTVLQQQVGNLGGLVTTGANSAAGLATAGQNNANSLSSLLSQQGEAQATGVASSAKAYQNGLNDLSKYLQTVKF